MKTKIALFFISALFLSACSFTTSSSDGGVFRSDGGGKTFEQKVTIDEKTKISSVDVLSMAANPQNGNEIYIGTKSSGLFKTTDGGEKWQPLKVSQSTPTKIYSIAIDPMNPNIVYSAMIVGDRGKIMKSTDAGANWKDAYTEPTSGSFVLALAIDPSGSGRIFGGTTKGQIIFSGTGGDTWQSLFDANAEVFKIAIDSANSDVVYFVSNGGGILRTKDGGKNFENLGENRFIGDAKQPEAPTAIIADPNRPNLIYAGAREGLFRSRDNGDNWELVKVLSSANEIAIRSIAINPQNSDEIVYGAAQAFYKSADNGVSWATTQFLGGRTIETIVYNGQNPGTIYVGMNKR